MKEYYQILNVKEDSSISDIKKAFREKIKKLHPDINQNIYKDELLKVLEAYEILSKVIEKEDSKEFKYKEKKEKDFNYKDYLKNRKDFKSYSNLILLELMDDNDKEAFDLYFSLMLKKDYSLEKTLKTDDFLDCSFLLAELAYKQKKYNTAYFLIKKIIEYEYEEAYFKIFFIDVLILAKKIIVKLFFNWDLKKSIEELKYICNIIPDKQSGIFLKILSELYLKENNKIKAREILLKALKNNKSMKLKKKLKELL